MHRRWRVQPRPQPQIQIHPLRQENEDHDAERIVARAEQGNPRALREILVSLRDYLVGQAQMPKEYALFNSEAFRRFAESEVMAQAGPFFKKNVLKELEKAIRKDEKNDAVLPGEDFRVKIMLDRGPRVPPTWIRRIGASFSHAFKLRATARRSADPVRATVAESPHLDHPLDQDYLDVDSMKRAGRAKKGDPESLRLILTALASHLRGASHLPREYAFFCSDALKEFVDSDPMFEAGEVYRQNGRLEIEHSPNEMGDAIPDLRKIERAFCRAFHISKPQGSQIPNHPALSPSSAWKVGQLRYFGESLGRSIEIVCSHYTDTSPRQVETWVREMGYQEPAPGTIGGNELVRRQWRMALRVLRETTHGATLAEAYQTVAREVVRDLVFLTEATVFLKIETVQKAYDFSLKCRSHPWWNGIWTYMERRFARPSSRRYQAI